jgi:hypothetical protein
MGYSIFLGLGRMWTVIEAVFEALIAGRHIMTLLLCPIFLGAPADVLL